MNARRVVLQMRQVWFAAGTLELMIGRGATVRAALLAAALSLVAALPTAPVAAAAPQPWNGRYQMNTYASQKAGTSPAARQAEGDFGAIFTLSTACSFDKCVATVIDGPAPGNPTTPQPTRFTWNGNAWVTTYDWLWDCSLSTGQKQWAHATSFTTYAPQPDCSLRGTTPADIAVGPRRGNLVMPVAAAPA